MASASKARPSSAPSAERGLAPKDSCGLCGSPEGMVATVCSLRGWLLDLCVLDSVMCVCQSAKCPAERMAGAEFGVTHDQDIRRRRPGIAPVAGRGAGGRAGLSRHHRHAAGGDRLCGAGIAGAAGRQRRRARRLDAVSATLRRRDAGRQRPALLGLCHRRHHAGRAHGRLAGEHLRSQPEQRGQFQRARDRV